ncbi:MAG: hypothetical protein ABJ349_08405 [Hyphomicrobiales bacterium]
MRERSELIFRSKPGSEAQAVAIKLRTPTLAIAVAEKIDKGALTS